MGPPIGQLCNKSDKRDHPQTGKQRDELLEVTEDLGDNTSDSGNLQNNKVHELLNTVLEPAQNDVTERMEDKEDTEPEVVVVEEGNQYDEIEQNVWKEVSPNKIGRQSEAKQSDNLISAPSRYSVLGETETDVDMGLVEYKETEEGEIQHGDTIEQSQKDSMKNDDPGTRISLHRVSKASHKYLSDSQAPTTKDVPSFVGKKKPNRRN